MVKYGKEPHFTQVRQQIDMQNRQLLQLIIRGASVKSADEMRQILETIKTLKNIALVPRIVEPIVEAPVIVEVKAIEEPKVEESKEEVVVEENKEEPEEAVVVEENKEETTEVAEVTEQVNPSTIITDDAAPEEENQEDQVKDEKHEVHMDEDGDIVDKECDDECLDEKVEVVQEQDNYQEKTPLIAAKDEEEPESPKADTPLQVESPVRKTTIDTDPEVTNDDNKPVEGPMTPIILTPEPENVENKPEEDKKFYQV